MILSTPTVNHCTLKKKKNQHKNVSYHLYEKREVQAAFRPNDEVKPSVCDLIDKTQTKKSKETDWIPVEFPLHKKRSLEIS